jgi:glutamate synthase domain-containing protein 3
MDMVKLEEVKEEDKETLYNLLRNHYKYTQSRKAKKIIESISDELKKFVKVIPIEYKRILEGIKIEEKLDLKEAYDG